MGEDQYRELIDKLKRPHRVMNQNALHRACEEAAILIEQMETRIKELQTSPSKKTSPKRA
jgi:hypothetical protein